MERKDINRFRTGRQSPPEVHTPQPELKIEQQPPAYKTITNAPLQDNKNDSKKEKHLRKPVVIGITSICLVIFISVIGFTIYSGSSSTSPLTNSVGNSVSFDLYYPTSLPDGYSYTAGSATAQNGIVFFGLKSGSTAITVSEQEVPSSTKNIGQLAGFKDGSIQIGSTYTGSILGDPTVIIVTPETLVTLRSSSGVQINTLSQVAKDMVAVKH
jgi:hypothetical protein